MLGFLLIVMLVSRVFVEPETTNMPSSETVAEPVTTHSPRSMIEGRDERLGPRTQPVRVEDSDRCWDIKAGGPRRLNRDSQRKLKI